MRRDSHLFDPIALATLFVVALLFGYFLGMGSPTTIESVDAYFKVGKEYLVLWQGKEEDRELFTIREKGKRTPDYLRIHIPNFSLPDVCFKLVNSDQGPLFMPACDVRNDDTTQRPRQ